jgi:RimJ/RimL family protein N-acetyltransferase
VTLETDRLILRPVTLADRDSFETIFGDPEVMRFVATGVALTTLEVGELIGRIDRRFAADGFGQLAVERRSDGDVIGRAGFLPLDPRTWEAGARADIGDGAEIELGWTFAQRAWGRGYAFEAAAALRDWARDELGLESLVSIIQVGNHRSVRLASRLGGAFDREITTAFGKRAALYRYDLRLAQDGS